MRPLFWEYQDIGFHAYPTLMRPKVSDQPGNDFTSTVEVAGCFCVWQGKILLLKRADDSPQGGRWCVPAGKMEGNERPVETAVREVFEETGLRISATALKRVGKLYVELPNCHYIFHVFLYPLTEAISVQLNYEHVEARWMTTAEALLLPLIGGGVEAIHLFCSVKEQL